MTTDQPPTRDDVDQAVRRAIETLVALGALEALPPADLARVGAAASKFNHTIASIARRRAGTARPGGKPTNRNPNGDRA